MDKEEKELINLTKNLIAFKTVSENKKEIDKCFDFIKKYMKGFSIMQLSCKGVKSLVISTSKERKKFDTILTGHIDVVPADAEQFNAKIKKGKIYGRGSADMKAGVALALLLMKNIKPRNVALILTSDEEVGGQNGMGYIVKKGYKADFVIALEPTKEKIIIKHKGVIWLKIKAMGKAAHASTPWLGVNAINKIINTYLEIKKLFPFVNKNSSLEKKWQRTINLGMVRAGSDALNKVPDYAELGLDIRYSNKDNPNKIINKIKKIAKKDSCKIEILEKEPMSNTSPKNVYIKKLVKTGGLKFMKEFGASDVRFFSSKGIPAVDFGPSDKNIHGKNEYVEIKSILCIYKILKKFIKSL